MEGFIIRICVHKYLWEGLIIVVNMMKSYRITYSIYIMYNIIMPIEKCRVVLWLLLPVRDDIRSRIPSVGSNRWLVPLEYSVVE